MISKMLGVILLIMALVITFLLITRGGSLVPHIVGPIFLTVVGVFLLARKTNAVRSAK
jgi:hypothetical protein